MYVAWCHSPGPRASSRSTMPAENASAILPPLSRTLTCGPVAAWHLRLKKPRHALLPSDPKKNPARAFFFSWTCVACISLRRRIEFVTMLHRDRPRMQETRYVQSKCRLNKVTDDEPKKKWKATLHGWSLCDRNGASFKPAPQPKARRDARNPPVTSDRPLKWCWQRAPRQNAISPGRPSGSSPSRVIHDLYSQGLTQTLY
jgi:hypothetical protein